VRRERAQAFNLSMAFLLDVFAFIFLLETAGGAFNGAR